MATSNIWQRAAESVETPDLAAGSGARNAGLVWQKRMFDGLVSGLALAAAWPLMVAVGAAIKLDSKGPVLFASRRWGKGGRIFRCIKFRTMTDGEQVTRVGRLLRRFGLDELPQLVNVLRGEMSLVGPRPLLAGENADRQRADRRRFQAVPGMTGLWPMRELEPVVQGRYFSPDESYRRNWSVWLDLQILLRTIPAAIGGELD